MSDRLTMMVNGKEYALTEDFKESIEKRARREFSENEYVQCHWEENERGDPLLCIETSGQWVPVDRLERLQFEYEEVEQPDQSGDDSDETEELDNGNGVKSVPKDDVDLNPGDGPDSPAEEEEVPDTGFMVTHPKKNYVPQPEEDDPEKVPPHPDELPEDPTYVQWLPADESITEHWSSGRALIPLAQDITWNLQIRADEAPEGATKLEFPSMDDGYTEPKEVPKTTRHDEWEDSLERHDCEVVAKKKPSDTPDIPEGAKEAEEDDPAPKGYSGRSRDDAGGKFGGDNWSI